jgi:DNA polymerase delta subunit 1
MPVSARQLIYKAQTAHAPAHADFQQLEVDYCAAKPDAALAAPAQRALTQAPILRMYGVAAAGNSVCAFLHGFEPYFFCKCSDTRCQLSPDDMPAFQEALNVRAFAISQAANAPIHTRNMREAFV